ncbi:chromosome partitioning protein ParB [Pandoraea aquatica]|uniref:Chromosome partitioning protein ParB n=1 Tax=Pandoraea aquatica TaxID=2508290 RepID=A0A5E4Z9V6_9BURK|nr:ParB/RepB/Spo0J family partition protein [Pandoraea aquatica]VVE56943.1 chromosome partitioning protein ParB [Pandoraea aquatica]
MKAVKASETINVPFKLLVDSEDNVNKDEVITPEIEKEYGETILANNGLLQNLVVTFENGVYPVVGGRKRRAGLAWLVAQGIAPFDEDYPVPVMVVAKADAKLASLAENVSRRLMHPAKLFRGIKELADEGRTFAFIAKTFNTSIAKVKGMLKLTAVSPKLFDLFENDKITVEEMQVLILADTHAEQEEAFEAFRGYWNRRPDQLRNLIVKQERNVQTDPHVKFVTLQAYEEAGGLVRRDLFADQDAGYILDSNLLHQLERKKLESVVADVKAEGWQWVEISVTGDEARQLERIAHVDRAPTDEEAAYIDALVADATAAEDACNKAAEDDEIDGETYEALEARRDDLRDRIARAKAVLRTYAPELVAMTGAFVGVGRDGELHIERGLVRREDRVAVAKQRGDDSEVKRLTKEATATERATQKGPHSDALTRRLSAHHSIALQAEIAANPEAAFVIALEKLAGGHFFRGASESVLNMSVTEQRHQLERDASDLKETAAAKALEATEQQWKAKLPSSRKELMSALFQLSLDDRMALFAFLTAVGINGVVQSEKHASRLEGVADVVGVDMTKWWKATATTYLSYVSLAQIGEVLKEAVSKEAAAEVVTMKKRDAVKHAEKLLANTGWLPKMMRRKVVVEPAKSAKPTAAPKKSTAAPKAPTKAAPSKTPAKKVTKANDGKTAKPRKPAAKTTSR